MNKLNKNHPRENSFMKFELRHNQTFTICLHDEIIRIEQKIHTQVHYSSDCRGDRTRVFLCLSVATAATTA
ncbi:unnamed protein product [Rotaria sordida]|uniref:Uncharacterized protein n=1 Tax=Rotaria sordida TaxID=392033 RepID=A0A815RHZ2_9BILA|nr:unnamed protein product [Rotaria sordida]CAF1477744.1 unnamed protein product [Rotaria sordida]